MLLEAFHFHCYSYNTNNFPVLSTRDPEDVPETECSTTNFCNVIGFCPAQFDKIAKELTPFPRQMSHDLSRKKSYFEFFCS